MVASLLSLSPDLSKYLQPGVLEGGQYHNWDLRSHQRLKLVWFLFIIISSTCFVFVFVFVSSKINACLVPLYHRLIFFFINMKHQGHSRYFFFKLKTFCLTFTSIVNHNQSWRDANISAENQKKILFWTKSSCMQAIARWIHSYSSKVF